MAVSAVPSSSFSADSSLLASLGAGGTGNAITADLQDYTQAKSAGDAGTADAAIVQLQSDLAAEQTQLLAGLEGIGETNGGDADTGLLSGLLTLNSNSDIGTALEALQNLSTQNAVPGAGSQGSLASATPVGAEDAALLATTGAQVDVTA